MENNEYVEYVKNKFSFNSCEYKYIVKVFEELSFIVDTNYINEFSLLNIYLIFDICKKYKEDKNIIETNCDINKNDLYFTTDIHGNLKALLYSLLQSGVVKFKNFESPIIYFNMSDSTIVQNISNVENIINSSIIPIPNLVINENFKGKFIFGGDIIDRGWQSDSCLCLMYHLLQQDLNNRITYIVGNHEFQLLIRNEYSFYNWILFGGNSTFFPEVNEDIKNILLKQNHLNYLQQTINNLVERNKINFCSYCDNMLFSHTIMSKSIILDLFNKVIEDKKGNIFPNGYEEYFTYYRDNIDNDCNQLSNAISFLLNYLFINKFYLEEDLLDLINKRPLNEQQQINFWAWNKDNKDKINGLNQTVGHTQTYNDEILYIENVIFADVNQYGCDKAMLLKFKERFNESGHVCAFSGYYEKNLQNFFEETVQSMEETENNVEKSSEEEKHRQEEAKPKKRKSNSEKKKSLENITNCNKGMNFNIYGCFNYDFLK